jgi:potassium-transporting ATPase KdpC subunit
MKHAVASIRIYLALTLLTGVLYTGVVTVFTRLIFARQAQGSLVIDKGHVLGSSLIGQSFADPRYFWPRPSAIGYNPLPSGGSNLSVTSNQLRDSVEARRQAFRQANNMASATAVPADMIFASGSGLDPHISPEAARAQIGRIAAQRRLSNAQRSTLAAVVDRAIEMPQLGFLGEQRVNVLLLNLALDKIQ